MTLREEKVGIYCALLLLVQLLTVMKCLQQTTPHSCLAFQQLGEGCHFSLPTLAFGRKPPCEPVSVSQ